MIRLKLTISCIAFIALFSSTNYSQLPTYSIKGDDNRPIYSSQEIAESGTYANGVYRNRLLGFSVSIPVDWKLMSDDANKALLSSGGKRVVEDQPVSKQKEFELSISNTKILFTAQLPPTSEGATLISGVETTAGGYTRAKYAEFNRNIVLGSIPTSKLKKDIYEKSFGKVSFSCFDLEISTVIGAVRQTYFVTMLQNNVLFWVATYRTDAQEKSVLTTLATVSFGK